MKTLKEGAVEGAMHEAKGASFRLIMNDGDTVGDTIHL
jgi:hypothetical protein